MKKTVFITIAVMAMSMMVPQFATAGTLDGTDVSLVTSTMEVTYEEIEASELPEAVTRSISDLYSGFSVDEAYKGSDGTFKAVISKGDMKHVLYYSKEGVLDKVKDPEK